MTDKNENYFNNQLLSQQVLPVIEPPRCDFEKYREYIEDLDLSEDEQIELIKTIWMIMATFVDLGFGVDSIQILQNDDDKNDPINSKGVSYDD